MAQHDYVIANGSGAAVRSDLNNALAAIVSNNSGATAPSTTYAYMPWADTTTGLYKIRNAANSGWITLYQLDGEWSTIAFENGTAAAPSIYFKDSGTDTGFYSPGTDQVGISTGGTARLTIDSSGNVNIDSNTLYVDAANNRVGLGTSSPGTALDINITGGMARVGGGSNNNLIQAYTGTSGLGMWAGGSTRFYSSANITFSTNATIGTGIPTGYVDAVTIDSSGRVGIGTATPANGRLNIATTTNQITLDTGDTATYGRLDIGHFNNGTFIGTYAGSNTNSDLIRFGTGGTERARIDSSGRLLSGLSSALTNLYVSSNANTPQVQVQGTTNSASSLALVCSTTSGHGRLHLASGSSGSNVALNDFTGTIHFSGYDGTNYRNTALVQSLVDGTPGTADMPGRLVFSTTADGAASPTEALRITNDQVICYNQSAPTSKSAAATLTVTELKTGIVQYTGAAATLTLPTGTLTEGGFNDLYNNMAFEWSVINTGSGTCTIGAGTAHTIVGAATVTAGNSGRFTSRRTASNTFVTYRLS